MNLFLKLSCIVFFLACFLACKKEVSGPQGPNGEIGSDGAEGADFNGFYIDSIYVDSAMWKKIELDEHTYSWFLPKLNKNVVESSLVLVSLNEGNSKIRLPFEHRTAQGNYFSLTYRLIPDSVIIERGGSNYPFLPSSASFEIMIVED